MRLRIIWFLGDPREKQKKKKRALFALVSKAVLPRLISSRVLYGRARRATRARGRNFMTRGGGNFISFPDGPTLRVTPS